MVPEVEKPRVTEIHVRIDCNGCVQKIKKALSGINGIYDLYIDFPQQKLTIIGWADPEKIVKAIKKTRKIATICSHTEASTEPSQGPPQTEQAPEGSAQQPLEASNPPPQEAPPPEAAPPAEPPQDPPPPENHPPPPQEPPPPYPVAADTNALGQPVQLPKDVGQVHVIHHHPPDYGYRYSYGHGYNAYWNKYHNGQGHPQEQQPPPPPQQQQPPPPPPQQQQPPPLPPQQPQPLPPQPIYATHSYNTYRPSPYVTEYEYIRSPPRHRSYYNPIDHYNEEQYYYNNGNYNGNGNGNITSIFSDENPNACRIV
ncbi:hypothetical protein UlMin_009597 [Ulmus minor]